MAIIFLSIIVAGIYGILHDQVTYTISNEYYTKFKFYQFGLADVGNEALLPNPRLAVAAVGFMATWWTGLIIGTVLGITAMIYPDPESMRRAALKAMILTVLIAIKIAFIGFLYGLLYLANTGVTWVPSHVIDQKNFIIVGCIHNFSYLGGAIGLITSVVFLIKQRKLYRPHRFAA